jgi:hypothetical protein
MSLNLRKNSKDPDIFYVSGSADPWLRFTAWGILIITDPPDPEHWPHHHSVTQLISTHIKWQYNSFFSSLAINWSVVPFRFGFSKKTYPLLIFPAHSYFFSGCVGGQRGLPGRPLRGHEPVRHPRQACHHHAEGHPAGQEDPWRARLSRQSLLFICPSNFSFFPHVAQLILCAGRTIVLDSVTLFDDNNLTAISCTSFCGLSNLFLRSCWIILIVVDFFGT